MMGTEKRAAQTGEITITTGFTPGALGEVVSLHGRYYGQDWGLNDRFEAEIAKGMGDLAILLLDPKNHAKNRQWIATKDGRVVGAIAIQQDSPENVARLRRFIVAEEVRGTGLGNRLMAEAMNFCREAGFDQVILWTYLGLDQARHLYEKNGFVLVEEKQKNDWGRPVTYVKFKCALNGHRPLIRKASDADKERAAAIVDEYCRATDVQHRDSQEQFAGYFEDGAGVWLAQAGEEVVGCILMRPLAHMPGSCEVKRLYVKAPYRGLCIADSLLHTLHDHARVLGYEWCYLDTKDDLKAAHRFYERHGYSHCERYNQNDQATIFMRRALNKST
jgi:GNAT superfamily N-acetyltransferase